MAGAASPRPSIPERTGRIRPLGAHSFYSVLLIPKYSGVRGPIAMDFAAVQIGSRPNEGGLIPQERFKVWPRHAMLVNPPFLYINPRPKWSAVLLHAHSPAGLISSLALAQFAQD